MSGVRATVHTTVLHVVIRTVTRTVVVVVVVLHEVARTLVSAIGKEGFALTGTPSKRDSQRVTFRVKPRHRLTKATLVIARHDNLLSVENGIFSDY